MGPVRRRLIWYISGLAFVLARPAFAQTCAEARPGWTGVPATALSEAVTLLISPLGIGLLVVSALAIRFRWQWIGLGTILGWTGFITLVTMIDPTGLRAPATAEGCIRSPTLFIALAAAICVAIVLRTKPRPQNQHGGDTET